MDKLIGNQRHSVTAIEQEVLLRKTRLSEQPDAVSDKFKNAFNSINERVAKQLKVLSGIRFSVSLVLILVTIISIIAQIRPDLVQQQAPKALPSSAASKP